MARTKSSTTTAPRNIDLDQHDGLVVDGHRDRTRSERQDMIDQQNHIKRLEKELGNAKKNFKKDTCPPPPRKPNNSAADDDEYESEERDEDENNGYFPSAMKSLGEVDASPRVRLRKAGSKKGSRQPFQDVDQLFNQPVADFGRTTYRTPTRNTSRADNGSPPLEFPSSSASPPPQRSSRQSSVRHSAPTWHQKPLPPSSSPSPSSDSRKRARSRSLSNAPPRKYVKDHGNTGRHNSSQDDMSSTTTEQHNTHSAGRSQHKLKPLRWLNDQVPSGRPKAHDYDHDICRIIIKSCREFSAMVCTQNALPTPETQVDWSRIIWAGACKEVEENYECTDRVVGLIKARSSNARAAIKDAVRPKISARFGFTSTTKTTGKIAARNKKICENLLEENAFHYKDTSTLTGFCQNKIISEALQEAWFSHKHAIGAEYSKYFNPIPLVTLALILTAIEFCIEEWSTGMFVKAEFNEKNNTDRYKAHLADVTTWRNGSPTVVDNICKKLFNRAHRNAGAIAIESTSRVTNDAQVRAQKELEGRTGETDSEAEDEDRAEDD